MVGIEKVCEFSGEHPGWLMYGYKRNHIQIVPKYRKLFRGADAILYVFKPEEILVDKWGGYSTYTEQDFNCYKQMFPDDLTLRATYDEYIACNFPGTKRKLEYNFMLKVKDATLQGEVDGEYFNYTRDLPATKKRLKRMLRCRNLKVVHMTKTMYEYFDYLRESDVNFAII